MLSMPPLFVMADLIGRDGRKLSLSVGQQEGKTIQGGD